MCHFNWGLSPQQPPLLSRVQTFFLCFWQGYWPLCPLSMHFTKRWRWPPSWSRASSAAITSRRSSSRVDGQLSWSSSITVATRSVEKWGRSEGQLPWSTKKSGRPLLMRRTLLLGPMNRLNQHRFMKRTSSDNLAEFLRMQPAGQMLGINRWGIFGFAKTFDKVPHKKMLHEIRTYGGGNNIHT